MCSLHSTGHTGRFFNGAGGGLSNLFRDGVVTASRHKLDILSGGSLAKPRLTKPSVGILTLHRLYFIGPILWGHSGALSRVVVVAVVVVVDIDAQAACDTW